MEECIFCKIVKGEMPAEIVYQDEEVLAFKDINPEAPVHILVIPRLHFSALKELEDSHQELIGHIFMVIKKVAREQNVEESGYRVVLNCGPDSGQIVHHMHFHIIGGRPLGPGLANKKA